MNNYNYDLDQITMYNCIRSMKKVLIVFNHPAPYKVRLFNELSKYFELHVIFERKSASDRQKGFYFEHHYDFISHKIKGICLGKENFISCGVAKHLKRNNYDLVIMNGYSTLCEMRTLSYLKKKRLPYVFYINGGLIRNNESPLRKRLKTKFISGARAYLSPDETSNKYLIHYGADESKIFIYPYSTIFESEIVKAKPNKKEAKEKLNIKYEKLFVSTGQLIRRKNYLSLVENWKSMPRNYGLLIFGDGKQRKEIERLIKQENLSNVELKGFVSRQEIFEFYKAADAFLFPSKKDIYGHVINEALSQGLPVIATKQTNSASHLIKDGENGFLIDDLSGEQLKITIEKIFQSEFYENCIKVAKENTIELMAKTHVEIFERILSK